MINENILDDLNLPLSSSNEDLETISSNYFKILFDVNRFEIRSETVRDKGIDFHIELKRNNNRSETSYLNFRFAVQLKATDSKEMNQDGSVSLQLQTTNINYLLNSPMPAFYVLYLKSYNIFYFESVNEFAKGLYEKDEDWAKRGSHVLRFQHVLDTEGINEIYNLTMKRGILHRTLNEKSITYSLPSNKGDKISIDAQFNITDDSQLRKMIEAIGFEKINEGKWQEIITLHKQASGNVASTSRYNLILGIANYYSGFLMEAISFFKAATRLRSELNEGLNIYLQYFEQTAKFSIGLVSEADYREKMDRFESQDIIGLYIKLEKAKNRYIESLEDKSTEAFQRYRQDIEEILTHPKANDGIKLSARCELILFEGAENTMNYTKGIAWINMLEAVTGPNQAVRLELGKNFIEAKTNWYKNVQAIQADAIDQKDYFSFFTSVVNEAKVSFEFIVYTDLLSVIAKYSSMYRADIPDKNPMLERMVEKVNNASVFFEQVGHIQNQVVALSVQYEIFHYRREFETANNILLRLETIIDANDLIDERNRFKNLKNKGTTHERVEVFKNKILLDREAGNREIGELIKAMQDMDKFEQQGITKLQKEYLRIDLFPIGEFQFPLDEKHKVYQILNISSDAQTFFDELFQTVVPIANIYYNPITQEGPIDGNKTEMGPVSWRRIFEIRKAFYEKKFYRSYS